MALRVPLPRMGSFRPGGLVRIAFAILVLTATCATVAAPHNVPLPGTTALEMVWISAGTFVMGSPSTEPGRQPDEGPRTTVTFTKGFWLGRTHVTVGQWKNVMGTDVRGQLVKLINDDEPHEIAGKRQTRREYMRFTTLFRSDLPMYFVSWEDAQEFCRRLTAIELAAGRLPKGYEYALPTEAQWEYAARGGTRTATYAPLETIAWYDANSSQGYEGKGFKVSGGIAGPRSVAGKAPNNWGLYDMTGNVWQWCRDWYGPYPGGKLVDPTGPATGTMRVNRGGSFGSAAADERSASRAGNPPMEASAYRGFRLALVAR